MTKKEKEHLKTIYDSSIRLCCSYFVTKDFDVARQIFYTASQFMCVLDGFEMFGEQLDPIIKGYGIDRKVFVDLIVGGDIL